MSNLTSWKASLKEAHTKFTAINPEKATSELGFAMQIFQNSDTLQRCDPQSILNAVVNVARTSVTLNPVMRLAYLVPRKNKCVLDFSYMGLVAMLRDNNCIKSISAHIVYENEEFDFEDKINEDIRSRGKQPHISFFGFTGTPKNKTLELFGRKNEKSELKIQVIKALTALQENRNIHRIDVSAPHAPIVK